MINHDIPPADPSEITTEDPVGSNPDTGDPQDESSQKEAIKEATDLLNTQINLLTKFTGENPDFSNQPLTNLIEDMKSWIKGCNDFRLGDGFDGRLDRAGKSALEINMLFQKIKTSDTKYKDVVIPNIELPPYQCFKKIDNVSLAKKRINEVLKILAEKPIKYSHHKTNQAAINDAKKSIEKAEWELEQAQKTGFDTSQLEQDFATYREIIEKKMATLQGEDILAE